MATWLMDSATSNGTGRRMPCIFSTGRRGFQYTRMYRQDLDYGQQYYDEITSDNIFALAIRKPAVPIKFLNLEEQKVEVFKEWLSGFSITVTGDHKVYNPILQPAFQRNLSLEIRQSAECLRTVVQAPVCLPGEIF